MGRRMLREELSVRRQDMRMFGIREEDAENRRRFADMNGCRAVNV